MAPAMCGQIANRQKNFVTTCAASKRVLEDLGGAPVRGYRAPTFSIGGGSKWAHTILAEEGYSYSSSVYPVKHDLYGTPEAPRTPFSPVPGMLEIPLTSVRMLGVDMPASGGGYFRLLPYPLTRGLLHYAQASEPLAGRFLFAPMGDRS